ncbi:hypothetical protein DMC61_03650 [Amycolatopsis sp. WAC 04169]|uniref:hypothetical protein n=1 Tax=Amycolatopsis sp. WAC 04169 TaxID=2203197 RepID=UPI000F784A2D|nr:hypothetical protein [Amycolatopsis sp. WAC 04169]RSN37165.1 hypothetical protein DMC61_03650 [Amycolatopsis sp. WAC 04169]
MHEPHTLIHKALNAKTLVDAEQLQHMLISSLGAEHRRPIGDREANLGLMSQSGSYDLKLIELATNMQDSVLERLALERFSTPERVPYKTPHEAAENLLKDVPAEERADLARVIFENSDSDGATKTKRLTAIFRDLGSGLTPEQVPTTIFQLGGSLKDDRLWQLGAFGMGGAMTYRNADAVVLVTRRHPHLLPADCEDRISISVVLWHTKTKGRSAYYLVDEPWGKPGDAGVPWSCPADEFPDFRPGTHIALISYGVEGIYRTREGDERTFDTVANTRLFNPVMPIIFTNKTTRGRNTTLRGLRVRLDNRSIKDTPRQDEVLPFHHSGKTYHLPVKYYLFGDERKEGGRDKFVAKDHVVTFTSNGQVHHCWNRQDFRNRTGLTRLSDRVFVTVDTDALPIDLRTSLFTPDRSQMVQNPAALRLEEAVAAFLKDWEALQEANSKLIREALRGSDRPTLDIARRISRAVAARGFRVGGDPGTSGDGPGAGKSGGTRGGRPKSIEQHNDPTRIDGPAAARAEIGHTRFLTFTVDVVDEFWNSRGSLQVECDHEGIGPNEITIGKGRNGRVRISLAVPDTSREGTEELRVILEDWHRAAGGPGPTLVHTCKLELTDSIPGRGTGSGKSTGAGSGSKGATAGDHVAVKWTSHERETGWSKITVGEVIDIKASDLANEIEDYKDLAVLGDTTIPTVLLNEDYTSYKSYLHGRSKKLTELAQVQDRYATGVGVELLLLHQEVEAQAKAGKNIEQNFLASAQEAGARAVLSIMPAFDELAKQAGLEE